MRANSLLVASAAILLSASAMAQQSPPHTGGMPASHPATGVATAPRAPTPNPLQQADVSKIEGVSVLGSDGKSLGDVSTVLMKPEDKTIDRLVVHTGGVLGIGGRYVAIPIGAFSWDGNKGAFTIAKTENDLKYMAQWKGKSGAATTGTGSSEPTGKAALPSNQAGK